MGFGKELLKNSFRRFARDDQATTAIEYSLIAVGISVAIVGVYLGVTDDVAALFTQVSEDLNAKTASP